MVEIVLIIVIFLSARPITRLVHERVNKRNLKTMCRFCNEGDRRIATTTDTSPRGEKLPCCDNCWDNRNGLI